MTSSHETVLMPSGHDGPPAVRMNGDIALVEFGSWPSKVQIHLGCHGDPARWLRDTAARLTELAEQVDALADAGRVA